MTRTLTPRTWYASKAARDRTSYDGRTAQLYVSRGCWYLSCMEADATAGFHDHDVIVTDRSMAHIDRLARDWIGRGVSPTKTGGRGVDPNPYCAVPVSQFNNYLRAEARVRRVVWQ